MTVQQHGAQPEPLQATIPAGHAWNRLPVAGLALAVLGSLQGQVGAQGFSPFDGLFWVVIVVSLSSRSEPLKVLMRSARL